jgi:hypothetical protein
MTGFLLGGWLYVVHRMARRRAACMVRKHGYWPVPSYGLREAHSPNLRERGIQRSSPLLYYFPYAEFG